MVVECKGSVTDTTAIEVLLLIAVIEQRSGLLLGTETPVMMLTGIDLSFISFTTTDPAL